LTTEDAVEAKKIPAQNASRAHSSTQTSLPQREVKAKPPPQLTREKQSDTGIHQTNTKPSNISEPHSHTSIPAATSGTSGEVITAQTSTRLKRPQLDSPSPPFRPGVPSEAPAPKKALTSWHKQVSKSEISDQHMR
jgi:hypothetical protein